ncbi:MAG TPA: protoporphyrinogen oxidase [Gemmataceae bacterium]|nr:protoporphyrinogen oxidase [Gemmataceae bacterium]
MPRIVIVGGGISGLSLAYRLQQRQPTAEVVVLEREPHLGGKVGTLHRDGFRLETGPNGFLDTNSAALDLCRDLGLGDRLTAASEAAGRNRFLFLKGKLRPLPRGLWSFLTGDALGWRAKLGILTERFRRPRRDDADESIDAFARRRAGSEIAETLADAFVTGIHAGDPTLLSMKAAFPRLAAMEREHGSVLKGMAAAGRKSRPRMWSFREGLGLLIDALRERLRTPPLSGVAVRSVRRSPDGGWEVRAEGRDAWMAEAVALTCPAYQQAALLADAELAAKIEGIAYNRVAVVGLGYRSADMPMSVDGFGYLSPQRERRDVLGVQWCSSIFPDRAPSGMVLLRALCGGWNRAEIVDWDDDRLLTAVRAELAAAMGVRVAPAFHHIVRWDRAIPQYHVGHLERVAWIEERTKRHPGLYLGGNAYRGVALNDCVEQAGVLAERMLRSAVESDPAMR